MDCVVLAGGRGIRLSPLTDDVPKPLLPYKGKAIIDYVIELLVGKFENIFVVIDYLGPKIRDHFSSRGYADKVIFIQQDPNFKGTMGALLSVKKYIKNDFLVICSDNLYKAEDIDKLLERQNSFLIRKVTKDIKNISYKNAKGSLIESFGDIYLEAGAWYLEKLFMSYPPVLVNGTKEFGIPQTIFADYQKNATKYHIVFAEFWYPVGTHWELNYVNENL